MSIEYTLISRTGDIVLVEYTKATGNFPQQSRDVLKKIYEQKKPCMSISVKNYCYHSMMEDNFIFLALAGKAVSKYVVYKFLEEIKNKFIKQISPEKRNTANAFSLTTSFSDVLKSEMERTNSLGDKLLTFKSNLVETKEIVETNIEKLLERGQQIDILVEKSRSLSNLSASYKRTATDVKRQMWWKSIRMKVILIGTLILIIVLIVLYACNWSFTCEKKN